MIAGRTMRVLLSLLLISLIPTLSFAATESVSLQLKWKHQFQFAGFYMAKEKGFYRDAGFDVAIREIEAGKPALQELQNGHVQYAVVDPGVLLARAEGAPVKVLAAIFQHSPLALIVMKESSIKRFSDLRGKRIMMAPGLNADISAALGAAGIAGGDFVRQDSSYNINDLVHGKTDAFSGYVTDQPNQLDLMGLSYRILHPKEQGIDFYGDILVTTEKMIAEKEASVRAFTEASMRGWEYALEHIDETIAMIEKKYNSQNLSHQQLQFEAQKSKEMIEADIIHIGFMRQQRWQSIASIYTEQGLLPKGFSVSEVIYQPEAGLISIMKTYRWELTLFSLTLLLLLLAAHAISLRRAVKIGTEELKQSEQRLTAAQHMAHIGSWELDLISDKLSWSDEIFHIFGLEAQEFAATYEAFLERVHPDDKLRVELAVGEAIEKGKPYNLEHRIIRADGSEGIVHEIGEVHFDDTGKALRMMGTVHDITQQRHLEKQLHHASKMEALGTLIGGIAHDFNSKVGAITGNIYLAKKMAVGSPDLTSKLNTMETLSFQMSEVLKQLITFTTGDLIQKESMDLNACLKETIDNYSLSDEISFHADLPEGELLINGASQQIQLAILKILDNAVDAIAEAPHPLIQISCETVEITQALKSRHAGLQGRDLVHLEIKDNGAGIPEENMEHILEPFFTTKNAIRGQGLGLSIAYGLIQNHDGVIDIHSSIGLGTYVQIYLPLIGEG